MGRPLVQSDDTPGADRVAISHSLWMERFGGKAAAIGANIRLDDRSHVIVGVMYRLPPDERGCRCVAAVGAENWPLEKDYDILGAPEYMETASAAHRSVGSARISRNMRWLNLPSPGRHPLNPPQLLPHATTC
jgi:hypothetical protein